MLGGHRSAPSWDARRSGRVRRVAALSIGVVVLAGLGLGGWSWLFHDAGSGSVPTCPPVASSPTAVAPATPRAVRLRVLNGTGRSGLARRTGDALHARGFTVVSVGNSVGAAGPPVVRYGAGAGPGAMLLAQQLPRSVVVADARLARGSVELVLTSQFSRLRTPAEVTAARSAAGRATARPVPTRPAPRASCP